MKKFFSKYWMVILAVFLLAAAAVMVLKYYKPARVEYEMKKALLNSQIASLQGQIVENKKYESVQGRTESEQEALKESRLDLYSHFGGEMKQEDQILYVLYLEELLGNEIYFSFGSEVNLAMLNDGSELKALVITVNYQTTYQGFKDMIKNLATDETYLTSVQNCTLSYDAESDTASGSLTLLHYILYYGQEYETPDIEAPEVGKTNIFD